MPGRERLNYRRDCELENEAQVWVEYLIMQLQVRALLSCLYIQHKFDQEAIDQYLLLLPHPHCNRKHLRNDLQFMMLYQCFYSLWRKV